MDDQKLDDLATRLFERRDQDSIDAGNAIDRLASPLEDFRARVTMHGPEAINARWFAGRAGLMEQVGQIEHPGERYHTVIMRYPKFLLAAEATQQ
jgi:hypothetical protein